MEKKKKIKDFYKRKATYKSACKICINKDNTKYAQLQKIAAIDYKGGKCFNCSYNKNQSCLEFHHKDPSKKDFTFGGVNRSFESCKNELDKCIMLCVNCHREEHFNTIQFNKNPKAKYTRKYRKKIKQEVVDYKDGCCAICKYSKCLNALEFHHRNSKEKDFGVGDLRDKLEKIKNEVDKCDLLCGNCHRELHN